MFGLCLPFAHVETTAVTSTDGEDECSAIRLSIDARRRNSRSRYSQCLQNRARRREHAQTAHARTIRLTQQPKENIIPSTRSGAPQGGRHQIGMHGRLRRNPHFATVTRIAYSNWENSKINRPIDEKKASSSVSSFT